MGLEEVRAGPASTPAAKALLDTIDPYWHRLPEHVTAYLTFSCLDAPAGSSAETL